MHGIPSVFICFSASVRMKGCSSLHSSFTSHDLGICAGRGCDCSMRSQLVLRGAGGVGAACQSRRERNSTKSAVARRSESEKIHVRKEREAGGAGIEERRRCGLARWSMRGSYSLMGSNMVA